MAGPNQGDWNQYMTDAVNLCVYLDAAITADDSERTARALIEGKERYFELFDRHRSLDFSTGDTAIVLWMVDVIQARLAALARLQHRIPPPAGVRDGSERGASALEG